MDLRGSFCFQGNEVLSREQELYMCPKDSQ